MNTAMQNVVEPVEIQDIYYGSKPEHYVKLLDPEGGYLPHFRGIPVQKGTGLIGDFFTHYAIPAIARAAPHVLEGVAGVIKDITKGKDVRQSVRKRGLKALTKTVRGRGCKKKI